MNLGVLHSVFEEHERAEINYERALALMERLDDHSNEAPVRFNLGLNLSRQERFADAVPHLRRALSLVRESGMGGAMQEKFATISLASALQGVGDTTEVQELVDRANAIDVAVRVPFVELELKLVELAQRADAGGRAAALAMLDAVDLDDAQIREWPPERLGSESELARSLKLITLRSSGSLRDAMALAMDRKPQAQPSMRLGMGPGICRGFVALTVCSETQRRRFVRRPCRSAGSDGRRARRG